METTVWSPSRWAARLLIIAAMATTWMVTRRGCVKRGLTRVQSGVERCRNACVSEQPCSVTRPDICTEPVATVHSVNKCRKLKKLKLDKLTDCND